jgi:hypothetical protein
MESIKINKMDKMYTCSLCGQQGHNKRSCPQKPIDDTFVRDNTDVREINEYIEVEESILTSHKEDILIALLVEGQGYGIKPDIFEAWLLSGRPCPLKNVKYTTDQGIKKDYMMVYFKYISALDSIIE